MRLHLNNATIYQVFILQVNHNINVTREIDDTIKSNKNSSLLAPNARNAVTHTALSHSMLCQFLRQIGQIKQRKTSVEVSISAFVNHCSMPEKLTSRCLNNGVLSVSGF